MLSTSRNISRARIFSGLASEAKSTPTSVTGSPPLWQYEHCTPSDPATVRMSERSESREMFSGSTLRFVNFCGTCALTADVNAIGISADVRNLRMHRLAKGRVRLQV